MVREQVAITGRDEALAELRTALSSGAEAGGLLVVRGAPGIGRTRLLETAARRWLSRGARVTQVRAGRERYGVDAVVDALRADFDRSGGPELIDRISALTRLNERDPEDPDTRFATVVAEFNRVFSRMGGAEPTAVLVDDVLEIEDPVPLLLAARRPGCLVVASLRTGAEPAPVAREVLELADKVLDLEPLRDEDVATIAGGELDKGVREALRGALGPLYGNPGAVLATVQELWDRGRIVDHRLAPGTDIALPADHGVVLRARRLGSLPPRLLVAAATFGALDLDDLPLVADVLEEDVASCERAVDELVEEGLLVGAGGRLRCACPALATALARQERDVVASLTSPRVTGARTSAQPHSVVDESDPSPRSAARTRSWSVADSRLIGLVGSGLTNRQIGSKLGLTEKTVESQLTRLFAKTGCRSRVELVAVANAPRTGPGAVGSRRSPSAWAFRGSSESKASDGSEPARAGCSCGCATLAVHAHDAAAQRWPELSGEEDRRDAEPDLLLAPVPWNRSGWRGRPRGTSPGDHGKTTALVPSEPRRAQHQNADGHRARRVRIRST
ncbi:LuxR family transcriptional regulator [Saccharopolyspora sp. NFXS83]|uniref:helix-turn-helix transcriptional regulator n=1 Tax=Saccharopolyspora sp. NFXS83 TaxID=2993560 RepID=UPI00224B4309|nr:LuxR family transcriptional regulator [Saccharopolyspora sp. NFXS83]MCX2731742.1 LuxR family transcriptional regulator [Saccharopolyspora sp. NFXS83]